MKSLLITIPAVLLMAACSSGSSNSDGNFAFSSSDEAFDALADLGDSLEDLEGTPAANIPVSGSATYDGIFSISQVVERFPNDPDPDFVNPLVGELELNVNFTTDTVSGEADNFFDEDSAVNGNISVFNGEIARDVEGALILADISGDLPVAGRQRDIEGGLVGVFVGDDAEVITGLVSGTADDTFDLFGVIGVED